MNNFEKIKNMTLDEMAEELYIHLGGCSACACFFICTKHDIGKHHCIDMYKQWLQQEARENKWKKKKLVY